MNWLESGVCASLSRCGCGVSAGAVTAEEQRESNEGSESKTLQYEARGGDQQTLQPAQNTSERSITQNKIAFCELVSLLN